MGAKVANVKEAFCAHVDGNEVYIMTKVDSSFMWGTSTGSEFLVKYPDYKNPAPVKPEKAEPQETPEEVSADIKGKILALTRRGWSTKDIAEDCKCSRQTVRNWQKKFEEKGLLKVDM